MEPPVLLRHHVPHVGEPPPAAAGRGGGGGGRQSVGVGNGDLERAGGDVAEQRESHEHGDQQRRRLHHFKSNYLFFE